MICTFFGHRDASVEIRACLKDVILDIIEQYDVEQFYVGNQGNFDFIVRSVLLEIGYFKKINFDVVLAYLPKKTDKKDYNTILPDGIENVPLRFAIEYRNKWMIDHSDIVVTYVNRSFGGAAKFKKRAENRGKIVIELPEK